MTIDFNNVRKQAVFSYDNLCQKLNHARRKSGGDWIDNYGTLNTGDIVIDPDDIQKEMDNLRMLIGTIAMTYETDDEKFADVYSEIFPENEDTCMQSFNPDAEDEG